MNEDFKGFHIRDSSLHEFLFKIRNIVKMKYGPKAKAPYHFIIRYYFRRLFECSINDNIAFKNLLGFTILTAEMDEEEYQDFKQKMDQLSDEINLGM